MSLIARVLSPACTKYVQRLPAGDGKMEQKDRGSAHSCSRPAVVFLTGFLRLGLVPGSPFTFSMTLGAAFFSTGCQLPLPCSSTLNSSSTSSMTVFCGARPCRYVSHLLNICDCALKGCPVMGKTVHAVAMCCLLMICCRLQDMSYYRCQYKYIKRHKMRQ